MGKKWNLSRYCIYTMRHADKLREAYEEGDGTDTVTEN